MSKITNYYICESDDKAGLGEAVRAKLEEGWQPYGNLVIVAYDDPQFVGPSLRYSQAVVTFE